MDPAIKWIGGATAAIALLFTAAMLMGESEDSASPAQTGAENAAPGSTPVLEQAFAVQAGKAADSAGTADGKSGPTNIGETNSVAPEPLVNASSFVIKRILPIEGAIKYGEWHWDETGVPDGPLVVTVDLEARVISVFRDGYEIGAAAVLLGTQDHPTPLGSFPILTKERHNVSEKYNNAPMPWTLRLTWDGIAIHGGAEVENGYASHGCIGTPNPFAAKLFAIAKKGDVVIITRGKKASMGQSLVGG